MHFDASKFNVKIHKPCGRNYSWQQQQERLPHMRKFRIRFINSFFITISLIILAKS